MHKVSFTFKSRFLEKYASTEEPPIWIPGAGSDHASFIFHAGVPVIDFGFGADTKLHPSGQNLVFFPSLSIESS